MTRQVTPAATRRKVEFPPNRPFDGNPIEPGQPFGVRLASAALGKSRRAGRGASIILKCRAIPPQTLKAQANHASRFADSAFSELYSDQVESIRTAGPGQVHCH